MVVAVAVVLFCLDYVVAQWNLTRATTRIEQLENLLKKERAETQSGNGEAYVGRDSPAPFTESLAK